MESSVSKIGPLESVHTYTLLYNSDTSTRPFLFSDLIKFNRTATFTNANKNYPGFRGHLKRLNQNSQRKNYYILGAHFYEGASLKLSAVIREER